MDLFHVKMGGTSNNNKVDKDKKIDDTVDQQSPPAEKKTATYELVLPEPLPELLPNEAPVCIPYWGRVVERSTAELLAKGQSLRVHSLTDGFPDVLIDGASVQNPAKSDFCPAWLVTPPPIGWSIGPGSISGPS